MPIRVLTVGLPPILRTLVEQALQGHADIEVLEPWDLCRDVTALEKQRPDVAIVPAPEGPASAYEQAVASLPGTGLVEIGGDSGRFVLRRVATNPGVEVLLDVIRQAAGHRVASAEQF